MYISAWTMSYVHRKPFFHQPPSWYLFRCGDCKSLLARQPFRRTRPEFSKVRYFHGPPGPTLPWLSGLDHLRRSTKAYERYRQASYTLHKHLGSFCRNMVSYTVISWLHSHHAYKCVIWFHFRSKSTNIRYPTDISVIFNYA